MARVFPAILLCLAVMATGCVDGEPPPARALALTRLKVDRTYLRDGYGRYLFFHGINLSGSTKQPFPAPSPGALPTYIGKPFPEATADQDFRDLAALGFNSVRLLVMWEGGEPKKRGVYDPKYLAYIRKMVQLAGKHGLFVLLDFHQDMFSRHLKVKFNSNPNYDGDDPVAKTILALAAPYNDTVQGDGAPRWAVQACLQEKKMDSPNWGVPRIVSGLTLAGLLKISDLYQKLLGGGSSGSIPPWALTLVNGLPAKTFDVTETTDMLPFTHWGLTHTLSLDVARCYACLYAGKTVFPKLRVGTQNVEDYLQQAYAAAWAQVARQVKDLDNVMGYDLNNEPGGNFIVLSAVAAMISSGAVNGAKTLLEGLLGKTNGAQTYDALVTLKVLPPDTSAATLARWGLDKIDLFGALGINSGFDENHLRPFYERVGRAILKEDPRALIFVEGSSNISLLSGGSGGIGGQWEVPMRHLAGAEFQDRVVFAPHWYPDIYPFPGFNQDPRTFTVAQVRYRNYRPKLEEAMHLASYSLGNLPTVFGEFGTYFNFNNTYKAGVYTDNARANKYAVSAHVLDNYFEAFEGMFQSHMLWCYSPENKARLGDLWNREDFSVLGPDRKPRAELTWHRPYARALAGKPIATHFYSDDHYFDHDKGVADPRREFYLSYASQETRAPTEVSVPRVQYPNGFYVWLSDGTCSFDPRTQTLYHYPARDEPGAVHWIRVRPPIPGQENTGWKYFFRGQSGVTR